MRLSVIVVICASHRWGALSMMGRAADFSSGTTVAGITRDSFDAVQRDWDAQVEQPLPLCGFDIGGAGDVRMDAEVAYLRDAVIADLDVETLTGRTTSGGVLFISLMWRGEWHVTAPGTRGETITAKAGSFVAQYCGPQSLFHVEHGASAKVLVLPAPVFEPLIVDRHVAGSVSSAEVRVLAAHASLVGEAVHALSPAGTTAARSALFELVRGVLRREFDEVEPLLAPALSRAAMDITDRRLADPELSPSSLARELDVSVRTLNRAFAAVGESVAAYIRRRRLERARFELVALHDRPSISEIAARWHFADSSHFVRSFKKQYAQTPSEFTRANRTNR